MAGILFAGALVFGYPPRIAPGTEIFNLILLIICGLLSIVFFLIACSIRKELRELIEHPVFSGVFVKRGRCGKRILNKTSKFIFTCILLSLALAFISGFASIGVNCWVYELSQLFGFDMISPLSITNIMIVGAPLIWWVIVIKRLIEEGLGKETVMAMKKPLICVLIYITIMVILFSLPQGMIEWKIKSSIFLAALFMMGKNLSSIIILYFRLRYRKT